MGLSWAESKYALLDRIWQRLLERTIQSNAGGRWKRHLVKEREDRLKLPQWPLRKWMSAVNALRRTFALKRGFLDRAVWLPYDHGFCPAAACIRAHGLPERAMVALPPFQNLRVVCPTPPCSSVPIPFTSCPCVLGMAASALPGNSFVMTNSQAPLRTN